MTHSWRGRSLPSRLCSVSSAEVTLYPFCAVEFGIACAGSDFSVPFKNRFLTGTAGKHTYKLFSSDLKAEGTLKRIKCSLFLVLPPLCLTGTSLTPPHSLVAMSDSVS